MHIFWLKNIKELHKGNTFVEQLSEYQPVGYTQLTFMLFNHAVLTAEVVYTRMRWEVYCE